MQTEQINVRIDAPTKAGAESIFSEMGISPAAAIRMFYRQVIIQQGLPFAPKAIPAVEAKDADMTTFRKRVKRFIKKNESALNLINTIQKKRSIGCFRGRNYKIENSVDTVKGSCNRSIRARKCFNKTFSRDIDNGYEFATHVGILARMLAEEDPDTRERVRLAVAEALKPYDGPAGINLSGSIWLISARA